MVPSNKNKTKTKTTTVTRMKLKKLIRKLLENLFILKKIFDLQIKYIRFAQNSRQELAIC